MKHQFNLIKYFIVLSTLFAGLFLLSAGGGGGGCDAHFCPLLENGRLTGRGVGLRFRRTLRCSCCSLPRSLPYNSSPGAGTGGECQAVHRKTDVVGRRPLELKMD